MLPRGVVPVSVLKEGAGVGGEQGRGYVRNGGRLHRGREGSLVRLGQVQSPGEWEDRRQGGHCGGWLGAPTKAEG